MSYTIFVLSSAIFIASAQGYIPTSGYTPYGYGYPYYRQHPIPNVQPYMQPAGQHFGFGTPDGYSGYNNQAEIIDVSPEIFREEMRKLGVLQRTSQRDFSEMQPQFSYADIQVPSNSPPFNDLPLATGPYYQSTQYIPGLPIFPYAYGTPYGIPQSNMVPQMVYTPVNNASTQNVQDGQTPSFPYPQVQAETPPVGPIQPEFTYIPTYQYKNQPAQPIVKKRRHRHRYVIKKDSSQNNGNQSESRVIDKHEVQRKTYSFRKTFVVTPEKRPSRPITINLMNGVPVTTVVPAETTVTTTTTTTEDNEIPEDTTGFVNAFKWN